MRARSVLAVSALVAALLALVASPALAAPANDNRAQAVDIASLPFADARSTDGATMETDESASCGMGASVWYRYTPGTDEDVIFDTTASDFDTVVAVYQDAGDGDLWLEDCEDDTGGIQARLRTHLWAGDTYLIQVGGYEGATGWLDLQVSLAPEPGTISGTITDEVTGDPIAGVCVDTRLAGDEWGWGGWGQTDEAGVYSISVDPGDHRVEFYACRTNHEHEWWDDKDAFHKSDIITVDPGSLVSGIDAALTPSEDPPYRPVDVAVTDLSVDAHPIRTDSGSTDLYTGMNRTVHVSVADQTDPGWYGVPDGGPVAIPWTHSLVVVRSCPRTFGTCQVIDWDDFGSLAGETTTFSFAWNGAGQLGDVVLEAEVITCDDVRPENDRMTAEHFVVAGGLDAGIGARSGGDAPDWYDQCGDWY